MAAGGAVLSAGGLKNNLTPPAKKPGFLTDFGEVGAKRAAAQTRWGRFLIWLEKKSPRLFARIGVKLAAMAGLAAVPIAGWIGAIINAGFLIWDAYAVYELWTEFNNTSTEETTKSTTPEPVLEGSNIDAMGNVTGPSPSPATAQQTPSPAAKSPQSPSSAPSAPATSGSMQGKTWNQLSKEEQDRLLMNQAIAEGWKKPTSIQHAYNNPGNITAPGGRVAAEQEIGRAHV